MREPVRRRLAIVQVHADGWRVSTIARYVGTTPHTVYRTLQRWVTEQFAGLVDKSHAPHRPAMKATLPVANQVRKLQQNPELGEWRIHAALLQFGINVSPRTCGRILASNRALYGLNKPQRSSTSKREMPYKAAKRHEFWSIDIRYIEHHRLANRKPVYVISILENYSRALLASALSPTQDLLAVLVVVFDALRKCGSPEAIVSDGGAVFRAKQLLAAYAALGIRREQIPQGQPWTNFIESHFGIMRRMADFDFAQATTWEEMLEIHARFMRDYNAQVHWAHRGRQDGRHSPAQVLGWIQGTVYPEAVLHRVLYAVQLVRQVDHHGYVRVRHWRFYGERGLAGKAVAVWLYEGALHLEYETVLLARYGVMHERDGKHIQAVNNPRLATTRYRSPQLSLFELGPDDWLLYLRLPEYGSRKRATNPTSVQLSLPLDTLTG
jgi:transposase